MIGSVRRCGKLVTVVRARVDVACEAFTGTQALGSYATSRWFASLPAPVEADSPEHSKDGKALHPDLVNANMRKAQYAVRGELYLKAEQLQQQGREIIMTNGAQARQGGCGQCS